MMEFPSHFTNEFFEKVLREGFKEQKISVKKFSLAKGADGGDNYCSDIFRVKVDYEEGLKREKKVQWLIIKYLDKIDQREVLKSWGIYENEVKMYKEMIPKLEETLKEIHENIHFSPKCLYVTETPVKMLIFEDLKALEFEVPSRMQGVNLEEAKIVMRKIAKFHASSVIVQDQNRHIFDEFDHGIFTEKSLDSEMIKSVFFENMLEVSKLVRNWSGFEKIAEKLEKIHANFNQRCLNQMKPRDKQLYVLNHGDLWINNIMLKYDKNRKVEDILFLDFQLSYWTGPGIDLNYFLDINLQADVIKNHRDKLVDLYCNTFLEFLAKLKYHSIPTFEKVKSEVDAYSFFGIVTCIGALPFMNLSKEDTKGFNYESLTDKDVLKRTKQMMFESERVQEILKYVLKRGDSLGVLD